MIAESLSRGIGSDFIINITEPCTRETGRNEENTKIAVIASLFLLVWLIAEMFLDLTGLGRLPALLRQLKAAHAGKVVLL